MECNENDLISVMCQCAVAENIYYTPSTEGIGISWKVGGFYETKKLEKCTCMKLNWNFQKGGEVLEKLPPIGEVWIFSGATQYFQVICCDKYI